MKTLLNRSNTYRLLSAGFRYPTAELSSSVCDGSYFGVLHEAAHPPSSTTASHAKKVKTTLADLKTDFVSLFEVGAPEPPCPPYEGVFREKEGRTAILLEVSEFYRHFGLRMNTGEEKRELADHLAAELEFMHFLTCREAEARQQGKKDFADGFRLAQKDFLERHLFVWTPAFSSRLRYLEVPVYSDLGMVLEQFVTQDIDHVLVQG